MPKGVATIRRVEVVDGEIPVTEAALRLALECAGVEFIDENGGRPGGRLRKSGFKTDPPLRRLGEKS